MALDTDDGDWIPIFRKIQKNWIWKYSDDLKAWIDLLMLANYHEGTFRFRRHIHPIKRGQVATTYKSLATRNGWGRNRAKGFLQRLSNDGAIVTQHRSFDVKTDTWMDSKADSGFILVTIVNYPVRKDAYKERTPDVAATVAANDTATEQRLSSEWTHPRKEEGKERKKGKEGRASAAALPTPAAAPAKPPPPAKSRQEVVDLMLKEVATMTPAMASESAKFDEAVYRGNHPYPEVFEAKKKRAEAEGVKSP